MSSAQQVLDVAGRRRSPATSCLPLPTSALPTTRRALNARIRESRRAAAIRVCSKRVTGEDGGSGMRPRAACSAANPVRAHV
jgi:hypothetical protein